MSSNETISRKVTEVLAEEFELAPDLLTADATLYDDLGLDSLDAVDMVVALEKAFGMKMTNEDAIRGVRTVGDLTAVVIKIRDQQPRKV
ncbi:MAG: acyl carrier protein [Deltaproteobacteria bacterium RIFOXYD12_FULL_50_9]|nr:MAG: acyl carrier protein [Deltaproteobacteria bacterium RIFOXYD12_FULL_50_9]